MPKKKSAPPAAVVPPPAAAASPDSLTPRAWLLALAGGSLALLGLFVLAWADPLGRGWASVLCPFLILGGYFVLGLGLFQSPPQPPPPGL